MRRLGPIDSICSIMSCIKCSNRLCTHSISSRFNSNSNSRFNRLAKFLRSVWIGLSNSFIRRVGRSWVLGTRARSRKVKRSLQLFSTIFRKTRKLIFSISMT